MFETDVVIIGAGPIGLFSIFQCGMVGLKCAIFDSMGTIGGQCTVLYPEKPIFDIPGFKSIKASQLINNLFEQSATFEPEILTGERVIEAKSDEEGYYNVKSDKGRIVKAHSVIIATGAGDIKPKKLPVPYPEILESKCIIYSPSNITRFKDAHVVIAGGGDSAADWALEISQVAKKIYLVHRRHNFRCQPHTMGKLNALSESKKLEFLTPYNIETVKTKDGKLTGLVIKKVNSEDEVKEICAEYVVAFFGLEILNKIAELFNVKSTKKGIITDRDTMMTSRKNIYAIGDAADYNYRPNLILTGFSEAALAARNIYRTKNPESYTDNFPYSTANGIPGKL